MTEVHVTTLAHTPCWRKQRLISQGYKGIEEAHALTATGIITHGMIGKWLREVQKGIHREDEMRPGLQVDYDYIRDLPSYEEIVPEYRRREIPKDMYKLLEDESLRLANNAVDFMVDFNMWREAMLIEQQLTMSRPTYDIKGTPDLVLDSRSDLVDARMNDNMIKEREDRGYPKRNTFSIMNGLMPARYETCIIDWKTGSTPNEGHHTQLRLYGSLVSSTLFKGEPSPDPNILMPGISGVLVYLNGGGKYEENPTKHMVRTKDWKKNCPIVTTPSYKAIVVPNLEPISILNMADVHVDNSKKHEECNVGFPCVFCQYRGMCNGI